MFTFSSSQFSNENLCQILNGATTIFSVSHQINHTKTSIIKQSFRISLKYKILRNYEIYKVYFYFLTLCTKGYVSCFYFDRNFHAMGNLKKTSKFIKFGFAKMLTIVLVLLIVVLLYKRPGLHNNQLVNSHYSTV